MTCIWMLAVLWNLKPATFKVGSAILFVMGFIFIFLGYMIRSARQSWFIGTALRGRWAATTFGKRRPAWDKALRVFWHDYHRGVFFGQYAIWLMLVSIQGIVALLCVCSCLYQSEIKRTPHLSRKKRCSSCSKSGWWKCTASALGFVAFRLARVELRCNAYASWGYHFRDEKAPLHRLRQSPRKARRFLARWLDS